MKFSSSRLIQKLLLRSDLARVGVESSPGRTVTTAKQIEWQRIGFIKLPLEPPFRINSFKDLAFIFINHEALRLLFCIIWLIVCGMIECFMAQLSDIRYSYVYQGKVKFQSNGNSNVAKKTKTAGMLAKLKSTLHRLRHYKIYYLMHFHMSPTSNWLIIF